MSRPVRLTTLAEADIARAQAWYEAQGAGLGNRFVEHVWHSIDRITAHPFIYQLVIDAARRANVPGYPYGLWYRVEPDESIVIGCFHHRRDSELARARALEKQQP